MTTDTVNAAAVRLPQFSPNQPLTCFRRAERHFKLKGITNSITKADYALEAVPEAVFQTISPWLDTQLEDITYETLKTTLLKEFSPPASVRASRLLDLPRQPIGDRTQHKYGMKLLHSDNCLRLMKLRNNINIWIYIRKFGCNAFHQKFVVHYTTPRALSIDL